MRYFLGRFRLGDNRLDFRSGANSGNRPVDMAAPDIDFARDDGCHQLASFYGAHVIKLKSRILHISELFSHIIDGYSGEIGRCRQPDHVRLLRGFRSNRCGGFRIISATR
ncbi:hypothetical protein D3C71_1669310 [compost metagenome]